MRCVFLVLTILAGMSNPGAAQSEKKPSGPQPERVALTPATLDAEVGQTVNFTAAAYDAAGKLIDQKPSTWFAAPFDVGAADKDGAVTLFAPGELKVGAIVNGKTGWATVRIRPQTIARIEVASPGAPLAAGSSVRLQPTAFTSSGNPRADTIYAWSSTASDIAAVDAAGLVTALRPGRASIRASSDRASGETTIEVVENPAASIAIEPRTTTVRTGDVVRFKATVQSAAGSALPSPAIQWTVGPNGAAIWPDGAFVASQPGTYAVVAASGDRASTASVIVTPRRVERELEVVGRTPMEPFQTQEQWVFGHYLYTGSIMAGKLLVYDLSKPETPVKVNTLSFDARFINDVSVSADGTVGIMTREGASNRKNGIVVLDTSNPAQPKVLADYTETVSGGVHSAYIDGRHVYLTDNATGSLRVVSIEDPKTPKEVARWEVEAPGRKYGTPERGEFVGGRYLHDVQVKDGLLYAAYWRHGLVILDVGNGVKGGSPTSPKLVSQLRFNHHELYGPGWLAGAHAVFRYKNYVFVGDEVFPAQFDLASRNIIPVKGIVHVVDVSDIEKPTKVAEYDVPEGGAHNIWVEDDVLYMGYYNAGARVVDVSGELRGNLYQQGREIARLWTGDAKGFRPNQAFAWGAQPHKGLVYFNDMHTGVWITRLKPKAEAPAPTSASSRR
jgi:plastocyanin